MRVNMLCRLRALMTNSVYCVSLSGGSMDKVLPVYEDATSAVFYNSCILKAVQAVISLLPTDVRRVLLEVGAGTGGTASSILPILDKSKLCYVFTDVSQTFLRQAQLRFRSFSFLEYNLLNIDADPGECYSARCQVKDAT